MSAPLIHGMTGTPEYRAWVEMRRRCTAQNRRDYKNYGARGISVCARWRASFVSFFADMGSRPGPGYTLERKNNNRGYTPKNCVWIKHGAQSNNRRMVKMRRALWARVTEHYERHGLTATAKRFNVCNETIRLTVQKHRAGLS